MKLPVHELLLAHSVLQTAISDGREKDVKLPAKAKYRLGRISDSLDSEYARLEKIRIDLIKIYGEEQFDPETKKPTGMWNITTPEKQESFWSEWKSTLDDEVELACQPLPLSVLGAGDSFFSVEEFKKLKTFVVEE